jgi:hypothetical protein
MDGLLYAFLRDELLEFVYRLDSGVDTPWRLAAECVRLVGLEPSTSEERQWHSTIWSAYESLPTKMVLQQQ